jgi:hypothetical protein
VTRPYAYEDVPRARRRRHPLRTLIIVLIVIIGLLVALDFGARAYAESRAASEIQKQGFPKKPNVDIEGFPFLTQVIARDFKTIKVSSTDVTEGPLQIQAINATANGVHLDSSFSGGTITTVDGTASVTFPALANAMTSQAGALGALANAGLTLSAASPDEVKATLNLVVTSGTAVWRVTRTGGNDLNISLVSSGGLASDLLSPLDNINLHLPALPLGLKIQNVSVTPSGLVASVTGQDINFGS